MIKSAMDKPPYNSWLIFYRTLTGKIIINRLIDRVNQINYSLIILL